ncbi:MAG: hypothetical protein QOJ25_3433 [Solirubrobacteraceae bacterium]|jgi:uncharacterized protein (DUF427 family)|nr:hypothetical protein [Solirubrobacteraceae bacterium]
MSIRLRDVFARELGDLRYEPIEKRIRGILGGEPVVDSSRAVLVWEPGRIVPSYAIPLADVDGTVTASAVRAPTDASEIDAPALGDRRVLTPAVPFSVHTTEGSPLTIRPRDGESEAVAFRPADKALSEYAILDFEAFDAWYEEDERNIGHPRDPFHRIEIVHSSRDVRVEVDGDVVAESSEPYLLFEPPLPVRYYLPREDVRTDVLVPSAKTTVCAYKGQASYWSLEGDDDIVWSYPEPMREAREITGRLAFFNERVDLVVDGAPLPRPVTPWSPR